jgi:hypothetical protein
MAIVATPSVRRADVRPYESPLASAIDRWIYVFMAGAFIAITLAGFVPDSLTKAAAVAAGQRPPFPFILHLHAMLMGAFLLLLLAQTVLAATGRQAHHQRLGIASVVLVPALVVVGFLLVPTMYQLFQGAAQSAPPEAQMVLRQGLRAFDNIILMQIRVGILFPLFIAIALMARKTDSGLHKRMMFLATALALPAAFNRIEWLPQTYPGSPLSAHLYILLAVSPMILWDLVRSRRLHKAYVIWLSVLVPSAILIHGLWGTAWWHATAPRLVGL